MRTPSAVVLDTHAWIWLLNGDAISDAAIEAVRAAAADGTVWVSAISVWEVGMLVAKGRLRLRTPVRDWVRQALEAPGIRLAELTPEIALESCQLPGDIHGDPADRILAATARVQDAMLITRDERILAYGRAGHLGVVPA